MNAEDTLPQESQSIQYSVTTWAELLSGVTSQLMTLSETVARAAPAVLDFTRQFAQEMETLTGVSQRTGITVDVLQLIGYAVEHVGGSADDAYTSLENIVRFINTGTEAETRRSGLNISARAEDGEAKHTDSIIMDVSRRLSTLPYAQASQYAQTLGIDENTLTAMRQGLAEYRAEYAATAQLVGINTESALASSDRFMTAFRSFNLLTDRVQAKAGAVLADGLAERLNQFRALIVDNFPVIEKVINGVVTAILWVADVTLNVATQLLQAGQAVSQWWSSLDDASQQTIGTLGGLAAAVVALSSAFALSPIGAVITLATAIAALIEDYNIWRSGGDSLIDWSAWAPGITYATQAIGSLGGDIATLLGHLSELGNTLWETLSAFLAFINLDTSPFSGQWLFDQIIESVRSGIKWVSALVDALQKLVSGDFSGAFGALQDAATAMVNSPVVQGVEHVATGVMSKVGETLWQHLPVWAQNAIGDPLTPSTSGLSQRGGPALPPDQRERPVVSSAGLPQGDNRLASLLTAHSVGFNNVEKYGMALLPEKTAEYIPMPSSRALSPSLQQSTTINVYGASDAQGTANMIVSQQEGVNSRTVQQLTRGNR